MTDELESLLVSWGNWYSRRFDYQGYPTRSIFASLTDPHFFRPGHKILFHRPAWIMPVDRMVSRIPKPYRDALIVKYCLPPENGRLRSERKLAELLGVSRSCYRQRLYRARKALIALDKRPGFDYNFPICGFTPQISAG